GVCPALSALTIDSQLAHLYLVSRSSSARKRRREDRKEAMKEKASTMSSTSLPAQELVLSVVISMPTSHSAVEGGLGDLFFGTTTMPWASLTIDEHEETVEVTALILLDIEYYRKKENNDSDMVEERALPPKRIARPDKTQMAISTLVKFCERYVTYEIFGIMLVDRGKCYKGSTKQGLAFISESIGDGTHRRHLLLKLYLQIFAIRIPDEMLLGVEIAEWIAYCADE
ncbi:15481_t:CDS:2, partial [Acaulospora colombiana]